MFLFIASHQGQRKINKLEVKVAELKAAKQELEQENAKLRTSLKTKMRQLERILLEAKNKKTVAIREMVGGRDKFAM